MFLHRKRCTRLLRPSGDPHALARPNCGLDDPLHGGGRSWSEIARAFKERQREREKEAERERERARDTSEVRCVQAGGSTLGLVLLLLLLIL